MISIRKLTPILIIFATSISYSVGENNFSEIAENSGAPVSFLGFTFGMTKDSAIKVLESINSYLPDDDPDRTKFFLHSNYFPAKLGNQKQTVKLILKFTKYDHLWEIEARFKNGNGSNFDVAAKAIQKAISSELCEKLDLSETMVIQQQHWGNIKLKGMTNSVSLIKAKLLLDKGDIQEGLFTNSFRNGLVFKFTGLNLFADEGDPLSEPDFSTTVNCYGSDSD